MLSPTGHVLEENEKVEQEVKSTSDQQRVL